MSIVLKEGYLYNIFFITDKFEEKKITYKKLPILTTRTRNFRTLLKTGIFGYHGRRHTFSRVRNCYANKLFGPRKCRRLCVECCPSYKGCEQFIKGVFRRLSRRPFGKAHYHSWGCRSVAISSCIYPSSATR